MTSYAAFDVTVPEMGEVHCAFTDAKTLSIQASRALLHEGLLYSLNGTLGLHGSAWYPLSGVTVTGQLGKNAPKKVGDPISEAVTEAVNEFLVANPGYIVRARQEIYDAQTKYLEGRVKSEQGYLDRYSKDLESAKAALAKHLETPY